MTSNGKFKPKTNKQLEEIIKKTPRVEHAGSSLYLRAGQKKEGEDWKDDFDRYGRIGLNHGGKFMFIDAHVFYILVKQFSQNEDMQDFCKTYFLRFMESQDQTLSQIQSSL